MNSPDDLINTINDMVYDLVHRKNDEDLTEDGIRQLLRSGQVTITTATQAFARYLREEVPDAKE
jgi:hypothetical protein